MSRSAERLMTASSGAALALAQGLQALGRYPSDCRAMIRRVFCRTSEVDVTLLHRGGFGDGARQLFSLAAIGARDSLKVSNSDTVLAVCQSCGQLHVHDDLMLEAKHDYAGLTMDEKAELAAARHGCWRAGATRKRYGA